jgi:hypothetical protein
MSFLDPTLTRVSPEIRQRLQAHKLVRRFLPRSQGVELRIADRGWTVEDLREDYGEDLLVRIFLNDTPTPYWFFVQIKSTDHIERYLAKKHDKISYPIRTEHLEHWSRFWEPVFLVLWDAREKCFYWECIQTAIEASGFPWMSKQKTISIAIPTANTLNEEGIRRIIARTKKRFNLFASQKEGADRLLKLLRSSLNLKVTYIPQDGILTIPEGRFVPKKNGQDTVVFFGRMGEQFAVLQSKLGITQQELLERVLRSGIDRLKHIIETFRRDGRLVLQNKDGTVRSWTSYAEHRRDFERDQELEEAD